MAEDKSPNAAQLTDLPAETSIELPLELPVNLSVFCNDCDMAMGIVTLDMTASAKSIWLEAIVKPCRCQQAKVEENSDVQAHA